MLFFILLFILIFEAYPAYALWGHFAAPANLFFILIYGLLSVLSYVGMSHYLYSARVNQKSFTYSENIVNSIGFSWIIGKLLLFIGLILEDVFRIIGFLLSKIELLSLTGFPARNLLADVVFSGLTVALMGYLLYGLVYGKYHFKTRTVELSSPDLPEAFDNFKVVQISDAHLGSFDRLEGFKKGIEAIKQAKPDLLLFTGDLVNNLATEALPYIESFKSLNAKYGKFAILGNHDYADYVSWPSEKEKAENLNALKNIHHEMGFQLLDNTHVAIEQSNSTIFLAGVENWGLPPFPQHGNLNEALKSIPKNAFTILMSHDPSHWDAQVKVHAKKVHLTLSGHTHGMQFGIDLPFFKWSPVKFKYPKWAGLYTEKNRHLYVNRGFGFLGFPGRSGIRPEVTVFKLSTRV